MQKTPFFTIADIINIGIRSISRDGVTVSTLDFASRDIGSTPVPATIKGWYTQKIIAIILVVCLLSGLTISASAVDVYATMPETQPLSKSSSLMATYDSGISVAAVEPSDLDEYLSAYYKSYNRSVAELLVIIAGYLDVSGSSTIQLGDAVYSISQLFGDLNDSLLVGYTQSYLDRNGSINRAALGLGGFIVDGIMGLAVKIDNAVVSINAVLGDVVSGLSAVNTSVGIVNTSVNTVDTSVNSMSGKLTGSSNASYLGISGQPVTYAAGQQLANINRLGFMGLGSHFRAASGSDVLLSNGTPGQTPADVTYSYLFRYGLLGLRSLLSGSETDNVYSSTFNDNNNTTTTVNSTGLGPLLNNQLSNIGENLGHLAYIFASDEDIKLREDSQPLLDTTDSFYDDSDSNVKVSTNNLGSLKDIAGNFTSIIDADADITDAFAVVSNSNTYRWFTADTFMNLDSLGVAPADFYESTYDRLHREFNEIYFPDRVGGGN